MAGIGAFGKITNLWPVRSSRPIEPYGLEKKEFKKQQDRKKKEKNESEDDASGKNIDEYV